MSITLPDTIEAMRDALRVGHLSVEQACVRQQTTFAEINNQVHATTYINDIDSSELTAAVPDRPLAGVGLAHKDIFQMTGRMPGLGRHQGTRDPLVDQAPVLKRLEQAGALNLGALTMAEDACAATAQTQHLPTPVNPLGSHLAVGGSSSGCAVAVASGMVYASLGTDTAGSVRIPAITCGVLGLKTTHGLIDRQGMAPLCPSLDSIGVLARSPSDIASVMKVLAPQLDWQPHAARLAYWLEDDVLSPDIAPVVSAVMQSYANARVDIAPHEARAAAWQELIMTYEVGQTHRARIANGQACKQVSALGRTGLAMPASWWQLALADRKPSLQAFIEEVFGQADVLLAPLQVDVLPTVDEVYVGHPAFSGAKLLGLHHYCGWVNYLGLPALALPVGHDKWGLPVSIQLIGKPFHEPQLLALGQQILIDKYGERGIMPVLRR